MTLDQLTLLTLIIPQVHFNYSSASCMFLSPFSFTWPTPSLFLFLQMSCCTEEVYILSCSKPKPSPTPQNYSSDFFFSLAGTLGSGCIWCFYLNPRWKQLSNRLLFYISSHSSLHLSRFSPSHSLSRSGSRALPFSTWWESCFIYTFLSTCTSTYLIMCNTSLVLQILHFCGTLCSDSQYKIYSVFRYFMVLF